MTIDWKKEVESRKDDLLNDLVELLKVKVNVKTTKKVKMHLLDQDLKLLYYIC